MRYKKEIKWILLNAFGLYLCFCAVTTGEGWQFNVFRFLVWLSLVNSWACAWAVCRDDIEDPKLSRIPQWLSKTTDTATMIILVAHGWFFTGAVWIVASVMEHYAKDKINDKEEQS